MKLTKISLSVMALFFFTLLCPAQKVPPPPPPPGSSAEDLENWQTKHQKDMEKLQRKISRNEKKESSKFPTATTPSAAATMHFDVLTTPEKVVVFFNDYVGKIIKFESLGIFELEAVHGTNDKIFGIDVSSGRENYSKTFMPFNPRLQFLMDEGLAREVALEQEEFISKFPGGSLKRLVNIYAEMRRGENESKIAYIRCIEFVNRQIGVTKSLGSCQ